LPSSPTIFLTFSHVTWRKNTNEEEERKKSEAKPKGGSKEEEEKKSGFSSALKSSSSRSSHLFASSSISSQEGINIKLFHEIEFLQQLSLHSYMIQGERFSDATTTKFQGQEE
jgi:hypothetical protein